MQYSDMIKRWRESSGLSQQKFGDLFRIPASYIGAWENGRRKPPLYLMYMMQTLLEHFGLISDDLGFIK